MNVETRCKPGPSMMTGLLRATVRVRSVWTLEDAKTEPRHTVSTIMPLLHGTKHSGGSSSPVDLSVLWMKARASSVLPVHRERALPNAVSQVPTHVCVSFGSCTAVFISVGGGRLS